MPNLLDKAILTDQSEHYIYVAKTGLDGRMLLSKLVNSVFPNQAAFPVTGNEMILYFSESDAKFYKWTGTVYSELTISSGGASKFTVTVGNSAIKGADGDYATIAAAILAGFYKILIVGSTNGTSDWLMPAEHILIEFGGDFTIGMGTYQMNGTPDSLKIIGHGFGKITFGYSFAQVLLEGITSLTLDGLEFTNNSTVANCQIVKQITKTTHISKCSFLLSNYPNGGIELSDTNGNQTIDRCIFYGGGANCYAALLATGSVQCSAIKGFGTFSTTVYQYAFNLVSVSNLFIQAPARVKSGGQGSIIRMFAYSASVLEIQGSATDVYMGEGQVLLINHRAKISSSSIEKGSITVNGGLLDCKVIGCTAGSVNGGGYTINVGSGAIRTLVSGNTTENTINDVEPTTKKSTDNDLF